MNKSYKDEYDSEEVTVNKSTVTNTPNLKGDWLNFYLLLLLYILQGFPIGLSGTFPIILQSRKMVTYEEQALFSIVLWPYTVKVLFAPLVDSLYIQRIGRRKSWLLPIQFLIGTILMYTSKNIDDWLPETGKPNLRMIICVVFAINVLSAIQDVVVDAWSLTMMKKNNVGYGATCNSLGLPIGMFIGSVGPILLVSKDFNNKYFRDTPSAGGLMTLQNFMYLWSIIILLITILIGIFKKEKCNRLELDHKRINVFQNYKLLWNILKKPEIKLLAIALLTARFGFSATDGPSNLKLIDAGVSKDDIMITVTGMYALKFIIPIFLSKYISGPKCMDHYLTMTPIRLFWNITYMVLIYYTPSLINNNGDIKVPVYYYCLLALIFAVNEMLTFFMLLALFAFFCRLSDPCFGGTYMALFNTFYFLGWLIPNTLVLQMIDFLTFSTCSNDIKNSCLTPHLKNVCATNGGSCGLYVDGYYITVIICIVVGSIWCLAAAVVRRRLTLRVGHAVKRHPVATVNACEATRDTMWTAAPSTSAVALPSYIYSNLHRTEAYADATVSCPSRKTIVDAAGHHVCAVSTRRGAGTRHRHVHEQVYAEYRAGLLITGQDARQSRIRVSGSEPRSVNCPCGAMFTGHRDSVCVCGPTIRGPPSLDYPIALHVRNVFAVFITAALSTIRTTNR